jgi:hypothetical protein
MGIHLLHCVHGNKRIGTHDAIHYTFAAIVWDVGFHMGQEQIHVLPSFPNLAPLKDLLFPMWFKPKNETITTNTMLINSSL